MVSQGHAEASVDLYRLVLTVDVLLLYIFYSPAVAPCLAHTEST